MARLDLPEGTPWAYAVFAPCFTCGKDWLAAARICRELAERGIAVLSVDFTGIGESGGDFADSTFSSDVDDLVRAADHLRENFTAPSLLIGHSLGGAAVLAAAHRIPETAAVATIGAPAGPEHVVHTFGGRREEIERNGEAEVSLGGRVFHIRREFLDDISAQPQAERIRRLRHALLVLHSPIDETVGVENAQRILDAARHPKSFVAIDGADHLLTDRADARYGATLLAAWAGRYARGSVQAGPA
ncbi:alpha/beta hydrolase [Streptomyces sp. NPDC051896]|uniref:alpha/beta hydrolase family protein n=1 Tax=Streptomyces sp. NPDC051896 TaxID=3155416 RepID=UPI00343413A5